MDAYSPVDLASHGLDREALKRSFLEWLVYSVGKDTGHATRRDWFASVALAVRDRVVDRWMETTRGYYERDQKRVYYLSLEFLIGRLLHSSMSNLGVLEVCREALEEVGVDLDAVLEEEPDQALGNGGLGRLAACFLDSMATLGIAGHGYGIRYEFGMFRQRFDQGWQVEEAEEWLQVGNPWEFERPEVCYTVDFYGHVEPVETGEGNGDEPTAQIWRPGQQVLAMAYDTPVVGWQGTHINTLRLWSARAPNAFNLATFNSGDYIGAIGDKVFSEKLSWVLYPNDDTEAGRELRLKQEYFFTSASLQDILRRFQQHHGGFDALPDKVAIQLNDTHPAIAVPELMRLLIDGHGLSWDRAWDLTRRTVAYTNHTLLPEALESWPVRLLQRVLPRHLQIIYEINTRFLTEARAAGADDDTLARLSLIGEQGDRHVRMGHLAFVGSFKVNGVSALHTDLMKQTVFADLHRRFPDRITNKTNGITPRRWLLQCNPALASLITDAIGDGWVSDLEKLRDLEPHIADAGFRAAFAAAKRANKQRFADLIRARIGLKIDPDAMLDVQIKRIHEYKRQLLNILHTVALYNGIRDWPMHEWVPRVKVFGGKAAAAYWMAKLIVKLGNDVARTVNTDPSVRGLLKVAFLPNYNVTLAERIIPAADLSEQISTAGKEASGTGNMKFALNGALTIGTLDGANVEIRDRVGADNIFIFGLTAPEVQALHQSGDFDPAAAIEADARLKRALDMVANGVFSPDEPGRFKPLVDSLYHGDPYLLTADFSSYLDAQLAAEQAFVDADAWTRKAALNTARVGWFSSDRTVRDYAEEIWRAMP